MKSPGSVGKYKWYSNLVTIPSLCQTPARQVMDFNRINDCSPQILSSNMGSSIFTFSNIDRDSQSWIVSPILITSNAIPSYVVARRPVRKCGVCFINWWQQNQVPRRKEDCFFQHLRCSSSYRQCYSIYTTEGTTIDGDWCKGDMPEVVEMVKVVNRMVLRRKTM